MKYCPQNECPHFLRTGSLAEYNDSIVNCADCGTELLDGEPPNQIEEENEKVSIDSPLVIIQSYTDPSMAHLAKSQLESSGIPVFLRDEQISSIQWLYSQAVGGVKLEVPESYAREAYELIVGEIKEQDSQENTNIEIESDDTLFCPQCGSKKISLNNQKTKSKTLSMLIGIPFSFGKNKYLCNFCKHKW